MPSLTIRLLPLVALLALVRGHAQILNAQGLEGSPASVGFQVNPALPRNCTDISPCQQDATIIRDAEIRSNLVNECGRNELTGNIDIGENTEQALAKKMVTQVKAGSKIAVTIHQVNADGAGPYVCDLVEAGNNGIITQNLTIENNVPGANGFSLARFSDFNMTVVMPESFHCVGASTGDVCTIRCRNNAQAGPFGGCFPVQQVDTTPQNNTPQNIATAAKLGAVQAQVKQDQKDFHDAIVSNNRAGSQESVRSSEMVNQMLSIAPVQKDFPVQNPEVKLGGSAGSTAGPTAAPGVNGAASPPTVPQTAPGPAALGKKPAKRFVA